MNEFSPILILLFLWLVVGLPLSKIGQAKKKGSAGRPVSGRPAAPDVSAPASPPKVSVPEAPAVMESRLAPTVSVTVDDDSVYAGSMNAVTGEGYDPCHEEALAGLNAAGTASPARTAGDAPALPFGWTGSDIVRGIVVSEIINRRKTFRG